MSAADDELIGRLAENLRPVQRLRPPALRATVWIGAALAIGVAAGMFSDLGVVRARMEMMPDLRWAMLGAGATAVCAAVAAFEISVPDRSAAWMLLPVPPAMLWLGASGLGCLRPSRIAGFRPAEMADTMHCVLFIVGVSAPLSVLIIVLLRRATPLRPRRVTMMAGLAAAGAAAAVLALFHPEDASATDLLMHIAAVMLVIGATEFCGTRVLGDGTTSP